jgi:hypothetical protein
MVVTVPMSAPTPDEASVLVEAGLTSPQVSMQASAWLVSWRKMAMILKGVSRNVLHSCRVIIYNEISWPHNQEAISRTEKNCTTQFIYNEKQSI